MKKLLCKLIDCFIDKYMFKFEKEYMNKRRDS